MRSTLLLLFCCIGLAISAQQVTYSRVKIFTDDAGLNQLANAGIAIDHGEYRKGCCFTTDLSSDEITRIHDLGFNYTVEIPDVQAYYVNRNQSTDRESHPATQSACNPGPGILTPANWTL